MEPNIHDGDYMLVEKISIYLRRIKKWVCFSLYLYSRGDIVIAKQYSEHDNCLYILKRVRAVAGETVTYVSPRLHKPVTAHVS